MTKKLITLLIFFVTVNGQNLDSLYNQLMFVKKLTDYKHDHISSDDYVKCGLGIVGQIRKNINKFSISKQNEINSILSRPIAEKSIVSPKGLFRIHYDETGNNAIGYDINELAIAFDSAYTFEVTKLGFLPPPSDNGLGGDDLYDVYVQNLGSGIYGFTDPENEVSSGLYSSYIMIDNDFGAGFPTKGIAAARVTAAHEFHHAIQLGNYSSNFSDLYYFEITSTAMEEFVYDDINDYYNYLHSFFADPTKPLYYAQGSNVGYNRAIWNIYLSKIFGMDIIKSTWESMRNFSAIESIASAIGDRGSSFKNVFNEFATWLWFTGSRAVPNEFFKEAENYPQVKVQATYQLSPTEITFNANHISNEFLLFVNNQNDSLVVIVSECDINSAINSPNSTNNYKVSLTSSTESGDIKIADNYFISVSLGGTNAGMFETSSILNNTLQNGNGTLNEIEFPYPQPFLYSKYNNIFLPVSKKSDGSAELYVYSSDMNLVFSESLNVFLINNALLKWNAKDNNGNKLPSGVYYFVTQSNDNIKKGKIVIIND